MTDKRKLKILKGALKRYTNREEDYMCWAVALELIPKERGIFDENKEKFIVSLGLIEPKEVYLPSCGIWYPETDRLSRIKNFQQAIKKLTAKLKTK